MWCPVTEPVKNISAGNPGGQRLEGTGKPQGGGDGQMNHLRTGGCGPSQRLPGNQSPLIFPGVPASLHPGPAAQRDQQETREEEGPGLVAVLEVVSFFLQRCGECP